jgi:hypothetical protein
MTKKHRQPPTPPPVDQPPQPTAATPEQAKTESSGTARKLPTLEELQARGFIVRRASGKSYALLSATGYQQAKKATEETQE